MKVVFVLSVLIYCTFTTEMVTANVIKIGSDAQRAFLQLKTSLQNMLHKAEKGNLPLDVVFVLDKSGSVGSEHFEIEKQFVSYFSNYLPVNSDEARVAVVSYSTTVKLECDFNQYQLNQDGLTKGIENIQYTSGITATGTALRYVQKSLMFNVAAGARKNALKIIYLLTDGWSNHGVRPSIPARTLKSNGVTIFALGVTNNIRVEELYSIASGSYNVSHSGPNGRPNKKSKSSSNKKAKYVTRVKSFDTLQQMAFLVRADQRKEVGESSTINYSTASS